MRTKTSHMDLRQLTYFVAVAEERHIGRAAERLCLSQPPLTRHIKTLEEDLGVELFVRTARGMVLTQAGEALLHDARNILGMIERAAERVLRTGAGKVGRLDVGIYGSATFGLIPRILAMFRQQNPEVDIHLHYAQTPAQIAALREGRVLLVFERLLPQEPDIEVELVAKERVLVALSEGHRLAKQATIPIASLKGETLRVGTSPSATATLVDLCRRHGFEPRLAPASDVIMATLHAAIGNEVTLVPASISNVRFPGIAYVELEPAASSSMDLYCFYLRAQPSPLLAAMLNTVREFSQGFHRGDAGQGKAPSGRDFS
jgi:DNA-binding transcriptional LysR family regulator